MYVVCVEFGQNSIHVVKPEAITEYVFDVRCLNFNYPSHDKYLSLFFEAFFLKQAKMTNFCRKYLTNYLFLHVSVSDK